MTKQEFSLFRHRLLYVGEIWKCSFSSMLRPTDHTNPSQKWSFQKCSSNQMTLTMPAFLFCGGSKHIENGALQKQWHHVNHGIPWLKHKSKMSSDCCIFKFVQHSVVIWCIFRVKPRFSIFSGTVWTGRGLNCQELWLNKLTPYSVLFLLWKQ